MSFWFKHSNYVWYQAMLALGKTIIAVLYRLKMVNQLVLPLHYLNTGDLCTRKWCTYWFTKCIYRSTVEVYSTELRRLTVHLLWAIACSTRGPQGYLSGSHISDQILVPSRQYAVKWPSQLHIVPFVCCTVCSWIVFASRLLLLKAID